MRIITLLNEKGGVGKTTLAVHIAAAFAMRGMKCVLVDTDSQGHAALLVNQPKAPGLYNLLIREEVWGNILKPIPASYHGGSGELYLVPSNAETSTIPLNLPDVFLLDTRLQQLADKIDLVVLDTSPSRSLLNAAILAATDALIYPTKAEYLSVEGLITNAGYVREQSARRVQYGFSPLTTLGIVPTMIQYNNNHSLNVDEVKQHYSGLILPGLHQRSAWPEASQERMPIWMHKPNSKATLEFWELLDVIEGYVTNAIQTAKVTL